MDDDTDYGKIFLLTLISLPMIATAAFASPLFFLVAPPIMIVRWLIMFGWDKEPESPPYVPPPMKPRVIIETPPEPDWDELFDRWQNHGDIGALVKITEICRNARLTS